METADFKTGGFRDRSSSRGARGRGSFQGRGGRGRGVGGRGGESRGRGNGGRGRGVGGRGESRGRGRGRGVGGRGESRGRGRGVGERGESRGRGGGERGRGIGGRGGRGRGQGSGGRSRGTYGRGRGRGNFRGGFRGEGGGRGRGGGSFRGGFQGERASSHSPSSDHERKDHNDEDNNSFESQVEKITFKNGEMKANFRHQRGERGLRRGRGQRHEGSNSNPKVPNFKKDQKKGALVSSTGKTRPQDVRRKYKLEPEETKKAILISNLPKKIESLHEEFKNFISSCIGPVKLITYKKITLCKVAFVNAVCVFEEASDSKLALEILHGQEFHDHHLLVEDFKNAMHDSHHTSMDCICVTNMSEKTSEEHLWKHFEGCGSLGMIHVNRNVSSGAPLEAIVNFKEASGVTAATKLNGSKLLDSEIKVVHLDRNLSIVVTNLNRQTTYQEIKEFFSSCNLAYFTFRRKVKKEQKAAIVYLADKPSHEKALLLNGTDLKGQPVFVAGGTDKDAGAVYDVFLLGAPADTSAEEVIKVFRKFGKVVSVNVPFKKCISRVSFKEEGPAQAAALLSFVIIRGETVRVFPNIAKAIKVKKREAKEVEGASGEENGKTLKQKKSPVTDANKKSKQKKLKLIVSNVDESDSQGSDCAETIEKLTRNVSRESKGKKRAKSSSEENNDALTPKKLKKSSQNKSNVRQIKEEPKEDSDDESSNDENAGYFDSVIKKELSSTKSKLKIKDECDSDEEGNEPKGSFQLMKSSWEKIDETKVKMEIKEEKSDMSSDDEDTLGDMSLPNMHESKRGKVSKEFPFSLTSPAQQKRKKNDPGLKTVKKPKKI